MRWDVSDAELSKILYDYSKDAKAATGSSDGGALLTVHIEETLRTTTTSGALEKTRNGFAVEPSTT
ncbi:hypothetical protein [Luteipulveratus mongoliensis]|uniref:Uncharacterized protein n=1 Tax=Luteipulveratus mongoliensis TaxID=571913 RepID=A0A0K1JNE1_9MICO|nr:hypothetical protein [Luteipulveratus mongoliensis]AKU18211.1 hypothetical protein VV02_24100 [Luteipulveratus mongoliensis]